MISQLEETDGGILSFDPEYLDFVQDLANEWYVKNGEPIRPWGFGKLYDSSIVDGVITLSASLAPITRTPGRYTQISTEDGKPTAQRLTNTMECIHRCVRVRIDGGGPGIEELATNSTVSKIVDIAEEEAGIEAEAKKKELATYVSPALATFVLKETPSVKGEVDHAYAGSSGVIWKGLDGKGDLPEDTLGNTEIRMLKRSVDNINQSNGVHNPVVASRVQRL
jgi:hypothetical protein